MSNTFFTSDHHFGHNNIIRFCDRPFESVDEMDEILIERWNQKVRKHDRVYHLGDFAMTKNKEKVGEIIDRLNGKIYLIKGNHESSALQHKEKFEWIKDYFELKINDPDSSNGNRKIMLFHYAMRTWRGSHHGNWHLYGHSHGTLPDLPNEHCFDIGVDCHDFYPLEFEEVKEIMGRKEWVRPF